MILGVCVLLLQGLAQPQPALKISVDDHEDFSRLLIESSFPLQSTLEKNGPYLVVKIRAEEEDYLVQRNSFKSPRIQNLGWSKGVDNCILTVKVSDSDFRYESETRKDPHQLIIDIRLIKEMLQLHDPADDVGRKPEPKARPRSGGAATEDDPASSGEPAGAAPEGLRTIVIDPGHGGLEVGAKGKFGTLEKDLTLDIALKLRSIIEKNLSYRVVLTRDKDIDVSLENRAATVNNNRGYVFLSLHVNGYFRKEASGSETYFLGLNATDEEARRMAYFENNSAAMEQRIQSEAEDDIMMILWDMAQTAYIQKSSQLAENIQKELNALLGTVNRGIKQAPFKVLTGVACPAVLVEVAFLSNPIEEKKLITEDFQNNVAMAVYRGLANFLRSYSQE